MNALTPVPAANVLHPMPTIGRRIMQEFALAPFQAWGDVTEEAISRNTLGGVLSVAV